MFILDEKYAVPRDAMNRAISGLLDGLFHGQPAVDRRRERTMRAAYYESYARLCLSSAYPSGVPSDLTDERLTVELIERAAAGVYSFRKSSEARHSQLALECRWMLEGLLGFHVSGGLEHFRWNQITSATPEEQTANLEILDAQLKRSRDELLRALSSFGSAGGSQSTAPAKRSRFGKKR